MAPVKESSKNGPKDGVAHGKVTKTTKRAGATIGSQQGAQKKQKQLLAAATNRASRTAARASTTDGQAPAPPQVSSNPKRALGSDDDSQKELPTNKQHLDNKQNPNGQKSPEDNQIATTVGEKAPAKLDVQGSSNASKNLPQAAPKLSRPSHHWRRTIFDSEDELSDSGQRMRMHMRSARLKRKRVIESDDDDSDEEVRQPSSKALKTSDIAELVQPPQKTASMSALEIAQAARPWKEGDPPHITANLLKDTKFQKYKPTSNLHPAATSSRVQSSASRPHANPSMHTKGRTTQIGRGQSWRPLRGPDAREDILNRANQTRNVNSTQPLPMLPQDNCSKRKAEGAHNNNGPNKRQRVSERDMLDSYVPQKGDGLSLAAQRRNTKKRKEERQAAQAAHAALLKREMQSAAKKPKTKVNKAEAKAKQTDSNKMSQSNGPEKGSAKLMETVKSSKENNTAPKISNHHPKAPISAAKPAGSPLSKAVAKALSSQNEPIKANSEGLADSGALKPSTADVKPSEAQGSQQENKCTPPTNTNEGCAAEQPASTSAHHRESLDSGYASKSATNSPPDSKTLPPLSNSSAKYPIVPPFGFMLTLPAPTPTPSASAAQSRNQITATDMGNRPAESNNASTNAATMPRD